MINNESRGSKYITSLKVCLYDVILQNRLNVLFDIVVPSYLRRGRLDKQIRDKDVHRMSFA